MNNSMIERILSYGFFKCLGMGLSIIFVIYLGRILTPEELGVYYLILTILSLCSIISRLGLDTYIVREISILNHSKDFDATERIINTVSIKIFKVSFFLMIIVFLFSGYINNLYIKSEGGYLYLVVTILPLFFYSMSFVFSEVFKAMDEYKRSVIIPSITYPSASFLFVVLFYEYLGELSLYLSVGFGSIVSFMLAVYFLVKKNLSIGGSRIIKIDFQKSFFFISIANYIFASVDVLFLGLLSSNSDVGVFSVILRIVLPFSFLLIVINNVFSRDFSILSKEGNLHEMKVKYYKLLLLSIGLGGGYLILVLSFGNNMLNFFGEEYIYGYNSLVVVSIGNFVLLSTGPSASFLMMSGKEKEYKNVLVFSGLISLVSSPILISHFGLLGAAYSSSLSLCIKNLMSFFLVNYNLRSCDET